MQRRPAELHLARALLEVEAGSLSAVLNTGHWQREPAQIEKPVVGHL